VLLSACWGVEKAGWPIAGASRYVRSENLFEALVPLVAFLALGLGVRWVIFDTRS